MDTKIKELIICVGISGSGKTTWTTDYVKQHHDYLRINRDDIRKTLVGDLNGYYQRKDLNSIEKIVNFTEEDLFQSAEHQDYNLIIDNTNLKQSYISRFIEFSDKYSYDYKLKFFDIPYDVAVERVCDRDNYPNINYIEKQYKDYQEIKKIFRN